MKRLTRSICAFGLLWLLVAMAMPASPAEGGHYIVEGWCLENDEGLEGLDVIVTNERTEEYLETTTDEDGRWSVDLDDLTGGWLQGDPILWESWDDLEPNGWGRGEIANHMAQLMRFVQNKAGQGPSTCYYEIDVNGVEQVFDTYPNPPEHFWGPLQITILVKMRFWDKRPPAHQSQNPGAWKQVEWWFDVECFDPIPPPQKKYTSAKGGIAYQAPPKDTGWQNVVINMNPSPPGMYTWVCTYYFTVTNAFINGIGGNQDAAQTTGHAQFCFVTHGGLPAPP